MTKSKIDEMLPELAAEIETAMATSFREVAKGALAWEAEDPGVPRRVCRAMLQACYAIAFEKLPHDQAVRVIAEALNELSAKHAPKIIDREVHKGGHTCPGATLSRAQILQMTEVELRVLMVQLVQGLRTLDGEACERCEDRLDEAKAMYGYRMRGGWIQFSKKITS